MKRLATAVLTAFLLCSSPVMAQDIVSTETTVSAPAAAIPSDQVVMTGDDTTVTFPWGNIVERIADVTASVMVPVLMGMFGWAITLLPQPLQLTSRWFLTRATEQLLERAVDYGLNAVKGASKDKALSVNVGSKVIAEAANYAVEKGSAALIEWLGGEDAIKRMVLSRINVTASAAGNSMGVKAIPRAPKAPVKKVWWTWG